MEQKKLTGIRKREQIGKSNRVMFMTIVIASIVVAIALVIGQFVLKQFIFNNRIIAAKVEAMGTLDANIENADKLKNEINKLVTNKELSSVSQSTDDVASNKNLRVILDALPSENDPSALTASFQHAILNRSGVTINSLKVDDQFSAVVDNAGSAGTHDSTVSVSFSMEIDGSYSQIRNAINDIEKVIRPLQIDSIGIMGSDNNLRAAITGKTYYLPAKSVNVTMETMKP